MLKSTELDHICRLQHLSRSSQSSENVYMESVIFIYYLQSRSCLTMAAIGSIVAAFSSHWIEALIEARQLNLADRHVIRSRIHSEWIRLLRAQHALFQDKERY